jgi:hypothetical protein
VRWRCYAVETLSADLQHYEGGRTYCTRHDLLRLLLESCISQQPAQQPALQAVAVDALGKEAVPLHPDALDHAEPCSRGASHQCTERKGISSSSGTGTTVEVVLAHCKEDSGWLAEVQQGLRAAVPDVWLALHVYEKCGGTGADLWPRSGWARERRSWLANKGEECFAYLSYVVTWWEELPEYLLFFQGDAVMNGRDFRQKLYRFGQRLVACVDTLRLGPRTTTSSSSHTLLLTHVRAPPRRDRPRASGWRSANDHQYIATASSTEACEASALPNCHHSPQQHRCMAELWHRHHPPSGADTPLVWGIYTNAQFGVSADRLRRRGLRYWRGLLAEFDGEEREQCYRVHDPRRNRPLRGTCALFEYMWPSFLGEPHVLGRWATMSGQASPVFRLAEHQHAVDENEEDDVDEDDDDDDDDDDDHADYAGA